MPMMPTAVVDPKRPIVFVNNALLKLTGYERHELIGQPVNVLLSGNNDEVEAFVDKVYGGKEADLCCRRRDGELFWASVRVCPVADDSDVVTHFVGSFIDLTRHMDELAHIKALSADVLLKADEVRALQAAMNQGARLSAIGLIGATMAHELNQPLSAITNYLRGAQLRLESAGVPLPEGVRDALTLADQSAMRAGHIIRRVRDLARRKAGSERRESLRAVVEEACDLVLNDCQRAGVEAVFDFRDDDARVLIDRVEVQQVIINLIHNAIEAVSECPVRRIFVSTVTRSDNACEVIVRDTGTGISSEAAGTLFQPFKSTKVNGIGIGLSISRVLIEAHGGRFWLESSTSDGAEFRFSLPRDAN